MKILVIGNGLIGKAIIETLGVEGHEILVFSRRLKEEIRAQQLIGDIFDFENFIGVLTWKPDVLIHTAWITQYETYMEDLSNSKYADFTKDLGRFLVGTSVQHLIILGTCAEYGSQMQPSYAGVTALSPKNLYAREKVNSLISVLDSTKDSSVRLSWVRIFHPYGPGQDNKRLIPSLSASVRNGLQIVLRDTTTLRDWITTRDIASAISWVINNMTPDVIDIGTGKGHSNLDLLRHIEMLTGVQARWSDNPDRPNKEIEMSVVDSRSPLLKSGWSPKDDLNSGLSWALNL
jgi:nucleoside-diphosphate-sugar epimerase